MIKPNVSKNTSSALSITRELYAYTQKAIINDDALPVVTSISELNGHQAKPQHIYFRNMAAGTKAMLKQGYQRLYEFIHIQTPENDWLRFFQTANWRLYLLPESIDPNKVTVVGGKAERRDNMFSEIRFLDASVVKFRDANAHGLPPANYLAVKTGGEFMIEGEPGAELIYAVLMKP